MPKTEGKEMQFDVLIDPDSIMFGEPKRVILHENGIVIAEFRNEEKAIEIMTTLNRNPS